MVRKLALINSTSNNNTKCNLFKNRDNLALVASWEEVEDLVVKQAGASEKLQIEINICVKKKEPHLYGFLFLNLNNYKF